MKIFSIIDVYLCEATGILKTGGEEDSGESQVFECRRCKAKILAESLRQKDGW